MDAPSVKPFLDYPELVKTLSSRRMIINDPQRAARKIEQIGYYHLSGYWHSARKYKISEEKEKVLEEDFRDGTYFDNIFCLYLLDKNLRVEFFNAIERIEIFLRTVIAHEMGRLSPLCYKEKKYFDKKYLPKLEGPDDKYSVWYNDWSKKIESKISDSKEEFIKDHVSKLKPIPIWVLVELWDFGMLSKFYSMLKTSHQDKICKRFDSIPANVLENWLININTIRNRCAHHGRLFNSNNVRALLMPQKGYFNLLKLNENSRYKLYGIVVIVNYFLTKISSSSDWIIRISGIINTLPEIPGLTLASMGFEKESYKFPIEKFCKSSHFKSTPAAPCTNLSVPQLIEQLLEHTPSRHEENQVFVELLLSIAEKAEMKKQ
ncbi:hypothetical protein ALP05_00923 [Pseudomonas caricapapayae]|uniref:Abortive infection bacteriophage resistance protein n=1 Tax=Pseudomonas caricapapayae TaxID=46678 RepID=A0A3M6FA30_9PSED|nr:Abi family protein [Pseudomonas caricapapayae]RMV77525.1 hypothetical protein ALP05_00923 [Pseudomonas caricapapayae]